MTEMASLDGMNQQTTSESQRMNEILS